MKYNGLYFCVLLTLISQISKANEDTKYEELKNKLYDIQAEMNEITRKMEINNQQQSKINETEKLIDQAEFKFYGNIRMDAAYDFKGTTRSVGNKTGSVPLSNVNSQKNALNVSVATSRFGVDIIKQTSIGKMSGKLEADFMGGNGDNGDGSVRVRHAYFSLGHWLIGQTTSPFVNLDTTPSLADFTGAMGTGAQRNVQLQYRSVIDDKQNIITALEGGDIENSRVSGGSRLPALTSRYEFRTKENLFQVHAMLHENRVKVDSKQDEKKWAWGIGIGAKHQLDQSNTFILNAYHVVGDNRYMSYSKNNDAFLINNKGDISQSAYNLFQLGYIHKWNDKFRSTFSIAQLKYENDSDFSENNLEQNKKMINVVSNLFWSPTSNIDMGVEYTYGKRTTFSDLYGELSRINLLAKYSF
ncbi:DcaP family trimeric outer membrane transporter [Acinetobacter sichuanensis]|uniref:DcaP family trimeric outer membrane transporter n=1 Tax=Acinetobacter sichuanensis TaxID=2136183 RepID=A0A371YL27_9GAMM|nr:DcaP family trimeric outer membrane transporter [Acinetobacter sichuanensis]RFC82189.1 DcaP-like protein [Acinetobacter sichuanensis]